MLHHINSDIRTLSLPLHGGGVPSAGMEGRVVVSGRVGYEMRTWNSAMSGAGSVGI